MDISDGGHTSIAGDFLQGDDALLAFPQGVCSLPGLKSLVRHLFSDADGRLPIPSFSIGIMAATVLHVKTNLAIPTQVAWHSHSHPDENRPYCAPLSIALYNGR